MKILVPIDDSNFSKAALDSVITLFRPNDTELHVIHIVESLHLAPAYAGMGVGPSIPADFAGMIEQWLDRAEELVSQNARRLESAGFRVTTAVKEGDAKKEILQFAEQWQPDLIVVGSHGRRGFDRILLGSVSEAVARHAHCSVFIVRPHGSVSTGPKP